MFCFALLWLQELRRAFSCMLDPRLGEACQEVLRIDAAEKLQLCCYKMYEMQNVSIHYSDLDYELSSPRHDQAQFTRSGLAASASRSRKIRVLTAAGEVSVLDMPLKFDQLQTR